MDKDTKESLKRIGDTDFPPSGTMVKCEDIAEAFRRYLEEEGCVPGAEMVKGWDAVSRACIRVLALRNRIYSGGLSPLG
jgi:hypothetical protein